MYRNSKSSDSNWRTPKSVSQTTASASASSNKSKKNSVKKSEDIKLLAYIFKSIAEKWFKYNIGFYTHNYEKQYILYLDKPYYKKPIIVDKFGKVEYDVITNEETDDYYNHLHLQNSNNDNRIGIVTQKLGSPSNICIMDDILNKYKKFSLEGHTHNHIVLYLVKTLYLISGYYTYFENKTPIENKNRFFAQLNEKITINPNTFSSLTKCKEKTLESSNLSSNNSSESTMDLFTKRISKFSITKNKTMKNSNNKNSNVFVKINNNNSQKENFVFPFTLTEEEKVKKQLLPFNNTKSLKLKSLSNKVRNVSFGRPQRKPFQ
jgi:hypothetical protein